MAKPTTESAPPTTPDGHYLVVRGRLWRLSDPGLSEERRAELVAELMSARRAVRAARGSDDSEALAAARARVDAAKTGLGERGPVWWRDGPVVDRRMAVNTPYAEWFRALPEAED